MFAAGLSMHAQDFNQMDEDGNITQGGNRNFNPHNNDTTKNSKEIPRGLYVWTIDRRLGDIIKAEVDTMPHLYPQSTMGTGVTGEYNNLGNNYSARLSRIFANRPMTSQFMFTDAYSQVLHQPDEWHFTNTLSPITNLSYDKCGDKTNGQDHLDARFAANFGKRIGIGFDLNYLYSRGYFQNQNNSHFTTNIYTSYLGDRYQLHALLTINDQKASENGGITMDDYIVHPEIYTESYQDNEIPVILDQNWNRHHQQRFFFTHRYALGFYRKVKMTDEELRARQFALDAKKEKEQARLDSLKEAGMELPALEVEGMEEAEEDSLGLDMKREFVPVTSFIHTLEFNNQERIYQAYSAPDSLYANTYFDVATNGAMGKACYDMTRHLNLRNTFGIALLEGFNRYVPAGLRVFATHELRRFDLPNILTEANGKRTTFMDRWTEHNVSLGAQLIRQQGHTLHYNATAETWLAGEDAGQIKLTAHGDLNFKLLGDTVRLQANAHFLRMNPTFLQRHFHGMHFWWDNSGLAKETRTRVEGRFVFEKTKTQLRLAIEEIQNYTYLAMDYNVKGERRQLLSAGFKQQAANLNVMTAQLDQKLRLGPLYWDNTVTYQSSSNQQVLPLPALNVFSNLYLKFMIAHVLSVELGGSATYFTNYEAPDFCPQLNQYAVQQNAASRIELGNFPFIDVYANLHLKHARFFVMMTNVTATSFNRQTFLVAHYPQNRRTLHLGISWNFFN